MDQIRLAEWAAEETDPTRRSFRQAMHLILRAIATSEALSPFMIMKGGILLAIRYHSSRFTKDVDFSTTTPMQQVDVPLLLQNIEKSLLLASTDNEYGLALILQSHKINPSNRPEAYFPTLQMQVAYAKRSAAGEIKKLHLGQAPRTIQIDYSFNEWVSETEAQSLEGGTLNMYAYHDLIAEKLRSTLQQPLRNRARFQDIYDLFLLVAGTTPTDDDKQTILDKLHSASLARGVPLHKLGMRQPEVIEYSQREYSTIAPLIKNPPEFGTTYRVVREFYESLPWS